MNSLVTDQLSKLTAVTLMTGRFTRLLTCCLVDMERRAVPLQEPRHLAAVAEQCNSYHVSPVAGTEQCYNPSVCLSVCPKPVAQNQAPSEGDAMTRLRRGPYVISAPPMNFCAPVRKKIIFI